MSPSRVWAHISSHHLLCVSTGEEVGAQSRKEAGQWAARLCAGREGPVLGGGKGGARLLCPRLAEHMLSR